MILTALCYIIIQVILFLLKYGKSFVVDAFFNKKLKQIKLYNRTQGIWVTDTNVEEDKLLNDLAIQFQNKAQILIYEYQNKSFKEALARVLKLKTLCGEFDATLIIKSRVDMSYASGADGVILDIDDIEISIAREILGENAFIGLTYSSKNADFLLLNNSKIEDFQKDIPIFICHPASVNPNYTLFTKITSNK